MSALPCLAAAAAPATGNGVPSASADAGRAALAGRHRHRAASALDRRIGLLTAELDLNAEQQAKIRAVLLQQRDEIRQLWMDTALPPPIRVGRTQAISDRTADRIRLVLNDQQREKYMKPRPADASPDDNAAALEQYMDAARGQ